MKTGKIFRALATGMVIVCLAAGCAKSGAESSDRKAILFSVPATRSAVTSLGEGDAFAVWARQSSAGAAQMILRQETVRCAVEWKTGEPATPERITVILSGGAIWKDPEKLEAFVRDLIGCDCVTAIE